MDLALYSGQTHEVPPETETSLSHHPHKSALLAVLPVRSEGALLHQSFWMKAAITLHIHPWVLWTSIVRPTIAAIIRLVMVPHAAHPVRLVIRVFSCITPFPSSNLRLMISAMGHLTVRFTIQMPIFLAHLHVHRRGRSRLHRRQVAYVHLRLPSRLILPLGDNPLDPVSRIRCLLNDLPGPTYQN